MKKRTKIICGVALAVFVLLLVVRFIVELGRATPVADSSVRNRMNNMNQVAAQTMDQRSESSYSKSNYASSKIVIPQQTAPAQILDQKYERVAALGSRSGDFDADAKKIRVAIEVNKALVQQENATGLTGSRVLNLSIGVVPEAFETTIEQLKAVGTLLSLSVTKTDKTADFKALEAKRISLEKTRDGLKALRRPTANLNDLMQLETKILEIEGQIQDLGVSLGDFEENNSLCTIQVYLAERDMSAVSLPIIPALLDAMEWTTWVYFGLVLSVLLLMALSLLLGVLAEKIIHWRHSLESKNPNS